MRGVNESVTMNPTKPNSREGDTEGSSQAMENGAGCVHQESSQRAGEC